MRNEIPFASVISRTPGVIASKMDDEYLIMNIETGNYIALRQVSARIWDLLEQPQTHESLVSVLLGEYDISPETCVREVGDFLRQMAEQRLIVLDQSA